MPIVGWILSSHAIAASEHRVAFEAARLALFSGLWRPLVGATMYTSYRDVFRGREENAPAATDSSVAVAPAPASGLTERRHAGSAGRACDVS